MSSQDPYKPAKGVEMGTPVDAPVYGIPVAAPGQPMQVDQYGRPIVQAVPLQVAPQIISNNANIRRDAQGNALCNKCSTPYPLPAGCTSWR